MEKGVVQIVDWLSLGRNLLQPQILRIQNFSVESTKATIWKILIVHKEEC